MCFPPAWCTLPSYCFLLRIHVLPSIKDISWCLCQTAFQVKDMPFFSQSSCPSGSNSGHQLALVQKVFIWHRWALSFFSNGSCIFLLCCSHLHQLLQSNCMFLWIFLAVHVSINGTYSLSSGILSHAYFLCWHRKRSKTVHQEWLFINTFIVVLVNKIKAWISRSVRSLI